MANELCSSGHHKKIKVSEAEAFGPSEADALRALRKKIVEAAAQEKDDSKHFKCVADCDKTNCLTLVHFEDKSGITLNDATAPDPKKEGDLLSGTLAQYKGDVTLTCHCEKPKVVLAMSSSPGEGEAAALA